ncbi:MAG: hypothetical protein TU36_000060 [Vulcanisaeta sp. AZ3]|jgi:hypothetical protein
MRSISYEKLMNFVKNNPTYEVREVGDTVELLFHAPTEEEAAGAEAVNEESALIRIVFVKRGRELIPREAWVERGDVRRSMSVDGLDSWLEFVDMYS